MKAFPEKMVLAAIILSCGIVAHSDLSAGEHQAKRLTFGSLHTWQVPSALAASHSARMAKAFDSQTEAP